MWKIEIANDFESKRFCYLSVQSGCMIIGQHCFMNQNVSVTCLKQIEIGVNCIIANNVVMVDHDMILSMVDLFLHQSR